MPLLKLLTKYVFRKFARAKEPYMAQTEWDLMVIDEAHRLRNVYKPGNKIGKAIKGALSDRHKPLLTDGTGAVMNRMSCDQ